MWMISEYDFNPHSHAGSDCPLPWLSYCHFQISIHTPTQGVTPALPARQSLCMISIHTPTQGVTHCSIVYSLFFKNFNPHSHAGSDLNQPPPHRSFQISIHTPTQGVTQTYGQVFADDRNFNPHSHAGSDISRKRLCNCASISIHTPTQGVTTLLLSQ